MDKYCVIDDRTEHGIGGVTCTNGSQLFKQRKESIDEFLLRNFSAGILNSHAGSVIGDMIHQVVMLGFCDFAKPGVKPPLAFFAVIFSFA